MSAHPIVVMPFLTHTTPRPSVADCFLIASRKMSTTRPGAVTIGAWSTGCDRTRARIRSAIKRCVSATIMRSCSAMRNQLGRSFHSGRFIGTLMHAGESGPLNRREQRQLIGRGILRERRGEGLVRKIDQPMFVRRQLGSQRMRLVTIKDIGDCLAFIGS